MDDSHRPLVQGPEPDPLTATPGPGEPRTSRSALLIVFLVVFIDLLGFGIVLPLLPLYGDELLEPLYPGQAKLHGVLLGLLMASFSFMQFIFAPIWGRLSDHTGRRPILLLGLGGSVVFYALFGLASELGAQGHHLLGLALLFLARLGAGVAGATISTAQAVIADSTPPDRRSRGMALIGAAFGIGFTFGPLLGFASLLINLKGAPGFLAAGLSLLAFLVAWRLLPETWRPGSSPARRRWFDWHGLQTVLHTPPVGILILTFFLATFAFGGLESTLALVNKMLLSDDTATRIELTKEAAHLTKEAASPTEKGNFLIFAYIGVILMLAQGVVYRRLVQRVGEVRFLRLGIALMALGLGGAMVILAVRHMIDNRTALLVSALGVMTIAVIGFAFLNPSIHGLISRHTDPARQGEILGVNQSASALARILGPLIGLSLFNVLPSHVLPYAFGTALLLLVFVLTWRLRED